MRLREIIHRKIRCPVCGSGFNYLIFLARIARHIEDSKGHHALWQGFQGAVPPDRSPSVHHSSSTPARSHASTVWASQMLDCTSPMCAQPIMSMQSRL